MTSEDSEKSSIGLSNIDNYVVTDQVFEAYVNDECDDNLLTGDAEDDLLWEYRVSVSFVYFNLEKLLFELNLLIIS
jgi:hypothetical protein